MKAVICEEKDGKDLMVALAFESMDNNVLSRHGAIRLREKYSIKSEDMKTIMSEVHGVFVYRVVQWLQKHGFDTTN